MRTIRNSFCRAVLSWRPLFTFFDHSPTAVYTLHPGCCGTTRSAFTAPQQITICVTSPRTKPRNFEATPTDIGLAQSPAHYTLPYQRVLYGPKLSRCYAASRHHQLSLAPSCSNVSGAPSAPLMALIKRRGGWSFINRLGRESRLSDPQRLTARRSTITPLTVQFLVSHLHFI